MNRKILYTLLTAEAVVCVLLHFTDVSFTKLIPAVFAFPFEQIASGLRRLSLSGGAGNIAAITIYITICLVPVFILMIIKRRRKLLREDALLCLLSVVLFAVIYLNINPGIAGVLMSTPIAQIAGRAFLGITVYSLIFGYLLIRVIRLFLGGGMIKLMRYAEILLIGMNAIFVFIIFGGGFGSLFASLSTNGVENTFDINSFFLLINFIVSALPYLLDIIIIFAVLSLIGEIKLNIYSENTALAAQKLSAVCVTALIITVSANIAYNLLQLLFIKSLNAVNSSSQLPVFSIAFILAVLLLTRLITENRRLKEDNDMFI